MEDTPRAVSTVTVPLILLFSIHLLFLREGEWLHVIPIRRVFFVKLETAGLSPQKYYMELLALTFKYIPPNCIKAFQCRKRKQKQKQCCRGAWGAWRFHRLVSKFVSLATLDQSPHLNALYQTELTPFDANASWGGKNPAKKWVWSYRAMNWQYLTQAELCRKNV